MLLCSVACVGERILKTRKKGARRKEKEEEEGKKKEKIVSGEQLKEKNGKGRETGRETEKETGKETDERYQAAASTHTHNNNNKYFNLPKRSIFA